MPPYYDVKGLRERAEPYNIDESDYPWFGPKFDEDIRAQLLADALNKDASDIHQVVDEENPDRYAIFVFTYDGYIWLTRDRYWLDDIQLNYVKPGRDEDIEEYTRVMLDDARGFETKDRATTYVINSNSYDTSGFRKLRHEAEAIIEDLDY